MTTTDRPRARAAREKMIDRLRARLQSAMALLDDYAAAPGIDDLSLIEVDLRASLSIVQRLDHLESDIQLGSDE